MNPKIGHRREQDQPITRLAADFFKSAKLLRPIKKGGEYVPDLKLTIPPEELGGEKGVLVKWNKEVGDWVRKNEELAVCQVDGKEILLKAPVQGVLQKVLISANTAFQAGAVLGILRTVMGGT